MKTNSEDWFPVDNDFDIDTPALLLYPDRIASNIDLAIQIAGDVNKSRPHVKTSKIAEVCVMLMQAGIRKFKCATIAEAEMLAACGAPDVLLAYQPSGIKTTRLLNLVVIYPETRFSCLLDNEINARNMAELLAQNQLVLDVYIDLNVGMNRTGVMPADASALASVIRSLPSLRLVGLHAYDGHIHDTDVAARQQAADLSFDLADAVRREIQPHYTDPLIVVMGGTPTFPMHVNRAGCECSPGTFVFWDWGYANMLPDLPFQWAALVITRVISLIDKQHVCLDLGYKAIASESPLPRICFLNAPGVVPMAQSEEYLVVAVPDSSVYEIGDVLYGVPVHICPTVALYDRAFVIQSYWMEGFWNVTARNRFITI